ncbi:MAG: DMT family transporter [Hyphomicrobiales bacterium]
MSHQAAPAGSSQSSARTGYVLLCLLTLFWGLNWPFMKIAFTELPVWWFRMSCVWVGGLGLLIAATVSGNSIKVPQKEIGPLILCAIFNVVGWHVFTGYGLSLMPAGRASIIAFTMPVWAALWSVWLLSEKMIGSKLAGLACGLAGLAVLMGPDVMVWQSAPVGALCMLAAAMSWGFGTVLFKQFDWSIPVVTNVGWQLVIGAVPITIGALILEPFPDLSKLSQTAVFAVAYVYMFPMLFCQWAYFKIVGIFPATVAAISTLMIPVLGVFSSAAMLGEPVGFQEFAAMVLICLALAFVLLIPNLKNKSV